MYTDTAVPVFLLQILLIQVVSKTRLAVLLPGFTLKHEDIKQTQNSTSPIRVPCQGTNIHKAPGSCALDSNSTMQPFLHVLQRVRQFLTTGTDCNPAKAS